jgi:hypothetical protein
MEEAAFMKVSVVEKVVVPLMIMKNSVLIAISTPDGNDNHYSVLLEKKNPDNPSERLFKVLSIGLACDACKLAKIASSCRHMVDRIPRFHDSGNRKLQRAMVSDEVYQAEQQGSVVGGGKRWTFDQEQVERAFTRPRTRLEGKEGVIYIGLDPNGGGDGKANLALTAWVFAKESEEQRVPHVVVSFRFLDDRHAFLPYSSEKNSPNS